MNPELPIPMRRVTPTAETHYNAEEFEYHLHDLCYNSEELAVMGDPDQAEFNLRHMLQFQREDGSLSNQVLTENASIWHVERWTWNNSRFSDYCQPAVLAQPIRATFDAYRKQGRDDEAFRFLYWSLPRAESFYDFIDRELRFSPDCALHIMTHPHWSGRDRDPMLNKFQRYPSFLERNGADTHRLIDLARVPVGYAQLMHLNLKQRAVNWEIAQARQNYCMVDPELNAKYAQNLYILAELLEELGMVEKADRFYALFEEVESDAKKLLYAPDAEWPTAEMRAPGAKFEGAKFTRGLFLPMDGNGNHVNDENSLGSLGAIGYRSLTQEQVRAKIRLALVSYNTFLPFSSAATESCNFDPHYQMKGNIHSGGVWGYQDRFLSDSFRWHGQRSDLDDYDAYLCELIADIAAGRAKQAFLPHKPEFAHPWTAEPQRPKVRGFNMSGQVNLMEHHNHLDRLLDDKHYFRFCAAIGRIIPITQLEASAESEEEIVA